MSAAPITLAVHGGAGDIARGPHSAQRAALADALSAGCGVLTAGGSAVDAVVAAVSVLEDSPHFNAGHGSVFTAAGTHELDAAVMDGASGRAGAVAAVTRVRNPVAAAALVMRNSDWVMLCGPGAEQFAAEHGARMVDPAYFFTRSRHEQLERARKRRAVELDHDGASRPKPRGEEDGTSYGTCGAVALDAAGNLAAATSTGGLTNKPPGRVGDSPIIGAGTYAENATVAVSATGIGEVFMRTVAAHDIAALVRYTGGSAQEAAEEVILRKIPRAGGRGGAIVLDRRGQLAIVYNTGGMYRGVIRADGEPEIAV
ncbi:MAG TPA: isoaspartyl peptidase/L-asparaginase [Burkholderiales bacterium]|nr:isoaspartyl peptidase/L-asparaginase [Burkholderiales bacterium]